jgi:hypothetical protein
MAKEPNMKKPSLIALIAVIGLALIACDTDDTTAKKCECPAGTTHAPGVKCCEGENCQCAQNETPAANAGTDFEHNITGSGQTVTLNGSGANGTYAWTCTPPDAATSALTNAATAEATAAGFNKLGEYDFTLTVSNGTDSATDTVTVTLVRTATTTFQTVPGTKIMYQPYLMAGTYPYYEGGSLPLAPSTR